MLNRPYVSEKFSKLRKKNRLLLSPETAATLKVVPQNLQKSPFVSDSCYL